MRHFALSQAFESDFSLALISYQVWYNKTICNSIKRGQKQNTLNRSSILTGKLSVSDYRLTFLLDRACPFLILLHLKTLSLLFLKMKLIPNLSISQTLTAVGEIHSIKIIKSCLYYHVAFPPQYPCQSKCVSFILGLTNILCITEMKYVGVDSSRISVYPCLEMKTSSLNRIWWAFTLIRGVWLNRQNVDALLP